MQLTEADRKLAAGFAGPAVEPAQVVLPRYGTYWHANAEWRVFDRHDGGRTVFTGRRGKCKAKAESLNALLVGLGQGEANVVAAAAHVDQGIPVTAADAQEEATVLVDLGRDGAKHDLKPAGSALPHGADGSAAKPFSRFRYSQADLDRMTSDESQLRLIMKEIL